MSTDDPVAYSEALAEELCKAAHRCRDEYPEELEQFLPFYLLFGETQNQCLESYMSDQDAIDALRAAIASERVQYDQDAADACLSQMRITSCDVFWGDDEDTVCDRVFTGTIANGESCAIDAECVSQSCDEGVCEAD